MTKILHMTPPDVKNGVYKYIFSHLPYFKQESYQFGFLTKAADELSQTKEYKEYGFKIHPLFATQRDNPKALEKVVSEVLEQYDVIHLHTSSWRGFMIEELAMKRKMRRVIVHSHNSGIDLADSEERERQIREHEAYRTQFSEKDATDFWACSHEAGRWLFGESINPNKIRYMPNAIDTRKFRYNEEVRKKLRIMLRIQDKYVIGCVGRYTYQKNQEFLIRILPELIKINSNICLICIGQGELKEEYMLLAEQLKIKDHILFLDWVDNVNEYLQAFDLFCLPSRFEGFPISIVEAQAAGLPCIVSSNVTPDIQITSLIKRIPLEKDIWIDTINNEIRKAENTRAGYDCVLWNKGYELSVSAEMLKETYDE